jgi:uncharacterized protein YjbI with pentapeptide repeats
MAPQQTTTTHGEVSPSVAPQQLGPGAGLRGADLRQVDLRGVDLTGADLRDADLRGVRCIGLTLVGAQLAGARLDGAQLLRADLRDADLTQVSAVGANLGGADLSRAVLFSADLTDTALTQATARGTDLRAAKLSGCRVMATDLTEADLTGTDLTGADLTEADVTDAVMRNADLTDARLKGIRGHRHTDWVGAITINTDFAGAYLARRGIIDQNYLHEFRSQSRRHEWIYRIWWLTSDCGRSFTRWGACTLLFALFFAGVYELVDIDYGDSRSVLSPFYFSIVTLTTLGYGDVLPKSLAAQAVVVVQVLTGYGMLGGLLSMFSTKMSRRGE